MSRNLNSNISYAIAYVKGSDNYNKINGVVKFYNSSSGTLVKLEINGLPSSEKNIFFGFHIHSIGKCEDIKGKDAFTTAGSHFDIGGNKHPNHTGDLPSIYSNNGYSYMEFFTNRFTPQDVIGKSVIIHEKKDDFITDPTGNSGARIACGVIMKSSQ